MKNKAEGAKLYDRAASCARLNKPGESCTTAHMRARLRAASAEINSVYRLIERRFDGAAEIPEACRWLLDNHYLALREGKSALGGLCGAGHIRRGSEGEIPAVLCRDMLLACNFRLDRQSICQYIKGAQSVLPIPYSEQLIMPAALRAELIEKLAGVCRELASSAQPEALCGMLEAIFGSLRFLAALDWGGIREETDPVESILRRDPAGIYPLMDEHSRRQYRERICICARKSRLEEHVFAERLVEKCLDESGRARHIGDALYKTHSTNTAARLYIAANTVITLFMAVLCAVLTHSVLAALLLLIPLSELTKSLLDHVLLLIFPPRRLPRLELSGGVPDCGRTICVISSLLSGRDDANHLAERLEKIYLTHRDGGKNLMFGILADLPESDTPEMPEDEVLISAAAAAVDRLNAKYSGGFYLFTRPRSEDSGRGRFSGFERKRGALLELARLLCSRESTLTVRSGGRQALCGCRFIVTLDSDTVPAPDSVLKLIGAMLHPVNSPELDEEKGLVTGGHGIIHPHMATSLRSADANDFARIFAGIGGAEAYGALCGEVNMDLFDSGGFSGKGIIDARALAVCTQKHIPDGQILSHDALEGAYLRGAYMSDVEFSESFPASPAAYFRRSHRWIRGDWQNIGFIFGKSGLPAIERRKLLDSLRRSLLAPATFAAIVAGLVFAGAGLRLAAWAALISLASGLLISLTELASERPEALRVKYHSRILSGIEAAAVRTFFRLWLLPHEAFICISAAVTALWRLCVSGKNLLEWETAAQGDAKKHSLGAYFKTMWFSPAAGLILLIFARSIFATAVGLFWLLAPAAAFALSLPAKKPSSLSDEDRKYLSDCARDIWGYFSAFCTEQDNFLPPDNFQEQPPSGIAHRTSPTNIGLALMSALCAQKLGIISAPHAEDFIGRMLRTMEKMPRYMGHFGNWYDTRTLRLLEPKYLSAVDCGNLCACLIALKSGLIELGAQALAEKTERFISEMDFSVFYDGDKELLHIGIDPESGCASAGLYDLMASEARLTSYTAIAKGDIPHRHWQHLSRVMRSCAGYRGMASWTGTMFEYLMPELFLPITPDSLIAESLKYCLFVQRRRKSRTGLWGISESTFFSLDAALNYRYKAHGCAELALKRGQNSELVIAPYAAFLALALDARSAVKNLKLCEKQGMRSRFGFYDAMDFTAARCRSESGERVRCFMAHHLGMSMLAAANALADNFVQELFMRRPEMGAYRMLLEEKIPLNAAALPPYTDKSAKSEKCACLQWEKRGGDICFFDPACTLLSNGVYNIMLTESGMSRASCPEMLIYRAPFKQTDLSHGIELSLTCGGERHPLLPEPSYKASFMWEFTEISCTFSCVSEHFTSRCTIAVMGSENGELRTIEIFAKDGFENAELEMCFEPVLADCCDYVNHPAYWWLGIEAKTDANSLMLHRLARGGQPDVWLCLGCSGSMSVTAGRIAAEGFLSEPLVRARVPLSLKAGEKAVVRFTLCTDASAEKAYAGAQRMLAAGCAEYGAMVSACASVMHSDAREIDGAMALLPELMFPCAGDDVPAKKELWKYGISSDLPIILCRSAEDAQTAARQFCLLRSCGVFADLVVTTDEESDYHRPVYSKLRDTMARHGLEALMDTHAGVHVLPSAAGEIISRCAATEYGRTRSRHVGTPARQPDSRRRQLGAKPRCEYADDGTFVFYVNRALPARAWSNMLTNGKFGYIAADSGMGNMWFENAREMRITPWVNDPSALRGPETLEFVSDSGRWSLFADNDGAACRVSFGFGFAMWEKSLGNCGTRCTAFIPPDTDARVFIIELLGQCRGALEWKCELLLAENDNDYTAVNADYVNSVFTASSSRSAIPELRFRAVSSNPCTGWTCDLFSWMQGKFDAKCSELSYPVFAARYESAPVNVLVCGCADEEKLRKLCKPDTAFAALNATKAHWLRAAGALRVDGTGKADRYMSGWAFYQTAACRLSGRCSMYQSGGAFGFRDQLQDAVNLILVDPAIAKHRILDCCRHQYLEGDVMHWWHSTGGSDRGVRTRCSDDLLWLVWALCEYTEKTGDFDICNLAENYVNSKPLDAAEDDRYETPVLSPCTETVLQHAERAVDCCIARGTGPHGLLRFGSGDWNDGMNRIGGESVWLSWFFAVSVRRFAELLSELCKPNAGEYRSYAERIGKAADNAWDGQWYLRGYWADGEKLGSKTSEQCRIDSVSQSWACLCSDAQNSRADTALDSALKLLFDRKRGIVKLFDPPFYGGDRDPGYIRSYGPGFRENGGQYTHAAVWLALACFRRARKNDGWEILRALLPDNRGSEYLAEPFVIAADVYTAQGHVGEAGWSWYTGSSGWYFRVFAEELLGLRLWHGKLYILPLLPDGIDSLRIRLHPAGGSEHEICINSDGILADGEKYDGKGIPYV